MNKFCFVIHPLSLQDIERYEPGAKGKGEPILRKIMEWMPPYAAAHVTGVRTPDGRETEGWFVAATFLPEQVVDLPREAIYRKVVGAIEIGAQLGAQVAGLGAFTGVVGDAGVTINERSPIPVTTGNSLTIAAGVQSLFRGAAELGVDPASSTAAVIGATGSIGAACVRLIAPHVRRIILVARNATRLRKFYEEQSATLPCESEYTTDVASAVRQSQLVLTATSSTRDVIEPEDLVTGAVVCELSLPHDVSRRVAAERPDVLVLEGGNMRVPGNPRFERVREPGTEFDFEFAGPYGAGVHERNDGPRARGSTRAVYARSRDQPCEGDRDRGDGKALRLRVGRHARVRCGDHAGEDRGHSRRCACALFDPSTSSG